MPAEQQQASKGSSRRGKLFAETTNKGSAIAACLRSGERQHAADGMPLGQPMRLQRVCISDL
jgi:hypothetical protein